jgi:ketosteroid isomerase-like protein
MAAVDDVDQLIEQFHLSTDEFLKGNPEHTKRLFSHQEDVTLANPLGPAVGGVGPVAHGWEQVAKTIEHASSTTRDGELTSVETVAKHVTAELAYVVQLERPKAKVGAREDITPFALRATMIFRPEDGEWKIVHRHADPITTPQPAESVIQE